MSLIINILKLLALTAAVSSTDTAIHKKLFRFGFTKLITSNEEMSDIMKIVRSLEGSRLLIKGVSEIIDRFGVEHIPKKFKNS